ncbi:hypothetical protein BFL28_10560 [Sphingomonas turrisvirgatae]|uniref:Holin n=2 Tax=Sphingomonas turrisvirgatae TaxID=1888892 RepID=A0A1E3LZL3_9SPHN|nr:hypothetical protein BFL28_10560 [Sphingomonas turrisvirgatae]
MLAGFEAWFAKWGWIVVGLTCGFAAKYALRIKRGLKVKPWQVFADVLLLPMVGLIAYAIVSRIGGDGEVRALIAGLCMVGADRLVSVMADRFLGRVENEAQQLADDLLGQARQTVQAELSGNAIINDNLTGNAPPEYKASRARRLPKKGQGE